MKEALQMCLEYIETNAHERKYVCHAIKEALAQDSKRPIESDYISQVAYTRALEAYCDGLAEPEQEPVAWRWKDIDGYETIMSIKPPHDAEPLYTTPSQLKESDRAYLCTAAMLDEWFLAKSGMSPDTKLYTSPPPQRKPLTDEDCTRIYNEANGITTKNPPITTERIFKAMRAAHGIKE